MPPLVLDACHVHVTAPIASTSIEIETNEIIKTFMSSLCVAI